MKYLKSKNYFGRGRSNFHSETGMRAIFVKVKMLTGHFTGIKECKFDTTTINLESTL